MQVCNAKSSYPTRLTLTQKRERLHKRLMNEGLFEKQDPYQAYQKKQKWLQVMMLISSLKAQKKAASTSKIDLLVSLLQNSSCPAMQELTPLLFDQLKPKESRFDLQKIQIKDFKTSNNFRVVDTIDLCFLSSSE